MCVCECMDLYVTVIRNRDVCVISARSSIELRTESAALRVQGEGVKVTERLAYVSLTVFLFVCCISYPIT